MGNSISIDGVQESKLQDSSYESSETGHGILIAVAEEVPGSPASSGRPEFDFSSRTPPFATPSSQKWKQDQRDIIDPAFECAGAPKWIDFSRETDDAVDGEWFDKAHKAHEKGFVYKTKNKNTTKSTHERNVARTLLSGPELGRCAEHRLIKSGVISYLHEHVTIQRSGFGRYFYTAIDFIAAGTIIHSSRGRHISKEDFNQWFVECNCEDVQLTSRSVAFRVFEALELIRTRKTDSALFWYHADLHPSSTSDCADLLCKSNRYTTVLTIANIAARYMQETTHDEEFDGRNMEYEQLLQLILVLDTQRLAGGYFPAAAIGLGRSANPNCEVVCHTEETGATLNILALRDVSPGDIIHCSFDMQELVGAGLPRDFNSKLPQV